MRKVSVRRPSPAMVVALLALVVAIAGTAYAANQISGTLIKKGSEPGNRLKDFSVAAKQINEGSLRHVLAGNVMAAEIPNGCQAQILDITASRAGNECNVTFPRPVSLCAIVLGTLTGSPFGSPGGGETGYRALSPTVIQVSRRDSGGANPTPGFFSIAAICPYPF